MRDRSKVTPLETQQQKAKPCPKCGAGLVFADCELREGRLLVLFRCHNPRWPAREEPQETPITRTTLRELSQPSSEEKFICMACGELIPLSDQEKANNLRMLDEEAGQGGQE